MNIERRSSLLILLACVLWALDLLVRYPISLKLNFVNIVFLESLVGLIVVSPWLVKNGLKEFKRLSKKDWLIGIFVGGIGMSAAGYLQTICIQKATPGTFSFFQIWQPIFVLYAARIFLKERPDNMYLYWGIWVVLSGFLMFSQDLEIMFATHEFVVGDILIAITCMMIWGLCTIASKKFLDKNSPMSLVSLRWIWGFIFASVIKLFSNEPLPANVILDPEVMIRFAFIGGVAGILGMYLYYNGLKKMAASRVCFFEVSFGAFGMIFSAMYSFEGLTFFQTLGAISFFAFIFLMLIREESQTPAVRTL